MLNIGKLSVGAAEYYVGEVATAAEDYYTGHGEAKGRWVGSIAAELGLQGEVDPDHFRRVLNGQHPFSETYLVSSKGSSTRAQQRAKSSKSETSLVPDEVDTLRAAAHIGVSARYVRMLLDAGDKYRDKTANARPGEDVPEPSAYLLGAKADGDGTLGSDSWTITRDELERFAASRNETKARPGYDLTLRPPKSVSVLWALAEPDQRLVIRDAHREAVDEVVRYYESRAVYVREGTRRGGRRLVPAAGIVAAAFDHRTSRAGDPLLHTHVVTANMTSTISPDGEVEWRTIPGAGLFEHAKAAGHLYQAHLRRLLAERLGVEFGAVVNGHADVLGVPDDVIDLFSKRKGEIAEMLSESGATSARAAQIATLETRKTKDYEVDADTLDARWRAEAAEAAFTGAEVARCFGRRIATLLDEAAIDAMLDSLAGPHGLTERSATFCRTDVIEAISSAAGASLAARQIEAVADQFIASDRALLVDRSPLTAPLNDDQDPQRDPHSAPRRAKVRRSSTQKLYTTPDLARIEVDLLHAADQRRPDTGIDTSVVEAVLAERGELSAEQQEMVRAACTSDEVIQPIGGRPGAGKTYATEAVVAAHVAAGVPIVGCSVSATAAAELERSAGFARAGAPATTVARVLWDLDQPTGGLRPGTVIVVDEASMTATRDLHRLVTAARAAGGAVKLIGDPDQHGAVDVGGVFRRLCADRGDAQVSLVENNRQQDHTERLAVEEYREGLVAEALARYDRAGKVVRSRTAGESFDAIVADWYAAHLLGDADPMIAGPNSTRRALNDRARSLLKANGELTGPALVVVGREFQVGDFVLARRNDRTLRTTGSRDHVKNGSAGRVHKIEGEDLVVEFEREGTVRVPHSYLAAGHLEHGYARTTYGVQGATHDVARYHPTDVSSFEEGYVAITRARSAARIYVVDGDIAEMDDDVAHAPPERLPFGMAEVADALRRRRGSHMAADASGNLDHLAATLAGQNLAQLTHRRRELATLLRDAPPAVDHVIDETTRTIDTLRARRNAWLDHRVNHPEQGANGRAERTVAHLDRAISRQERRLRAAEQQAAERSTWLAEHSDVVTEYDLVGRAERAREIQIAAAAVHDVPSTLHSVIGPEPASQRERHTWRKAVESAAIYRERYGVTATGNGPDLVLGPMPSDALGVAERSEALAAISAAAVNRARGLDVGAEL